MSIKSLIKRILFPNSYSSDAYINYLRSKHVSIGDNCIIYSPNKTSIDVERGHMLKIGDYVKITSGVKILTHDYSRSVLCNLSEYGDVGEAAVTKIGNNVFIGVNSIILMGSQIGNNTIVGAGSVVSGVFPDNVVIAGNPARVICDIKQYYEKQKSKELEAAKLYAKEWKVVHGEYPSVRDMTNSFMWLYLPRTDDSIEEYSELFLLNGVCREHYLNSFFNSKPAYSSFDEFIKDCE